MTTCYSQARTNLQQTKRKWLLRWNTLIRSSSLTSLGTLHWYTCCKILVSKETIAIHWWTYEVHSRPLGWSLSMEINCPNEFCKSLEFKLCLMKGLSSIFQLFKIRYGGSPLISMLIISWVVHLSLQAPDCIVFHSCSPRGFWYYSQDKTRILLFS